jgi:hypothetical protein
VTTPPDGADGIGEVDPFDLPSWLGEGEVVWSPEGSIRGGHHVAGTLAVAGGGDQDGLPCDLLAVDEAYPKPVASDELRHQAHQAWRHGQVHLVTYDGRLTLVVPGTEFTADRVLQALARLARAVGAEPARYAALLRLGE